DYQDWISYITAGLVLSALIWWQLRRQQKSDQALARRQEITRTLIQEAELRLDDERRLLELARAAVAGFADWCLIDLVDEQMVVKRAAVVHANPAWGAEADLLRQIDLNQTHHVSRIQKRMESGEPALLQVLTTEGLSAVAATESERRLLISLRLRSAIVVPIRAGARAAGVIHFLMAGSGRRFEAADLVLARELSDRLGTALEHAQLLRQTLAAEERAESEAQKARDRLRAQLELTQAVTDSMVEGIFAIDRNGLVTFVNQAAEELLGWPKAETVGHCGAVIPGCDPTRADCLHSGCQIAQVLHTGRSHTIRDAVFRRKDGSGIDVSYTATPIRHDGVTTGVAVSFYDVTARNAAELARRQAEEALEEQKRLYRLLADNARDLVLLMSAGGAIQYASPSCVSLLGYTPEELVDMGDQVIPGIVHPASYGAMKHVLALVQNGADPPPLIFQALHKDGAYRWLEAVAAGVRTSDGHKRQIQVTLRDVTERKQFEEQLAHQAFHDALTDLPNRSLLWSRLEHALRRGERRQEQVAVLFLDLDDFKVVNDSLGHDAGDQLLIQFSHRLGECCRAEGTIARMGGDEFAILLESDGGRTEAIAVVQRIAAALRPPFMVGGHEVFISASTGIVLASAGQYQDPGALLRDADAAMYRAKAKGQGRYELFDPGMNQEDLERLELETDLRHAVERNELRLYFQPIVSLVDGAVEGLEALVRWHHPERGLLEPGQFIPLAEETGLIIAVGRWVLEAACRQLTEWQQRYQLPDPFYVSVNISARQLQQSDMVERVRSQLEATGLAPERLLLEITESVIVHETAHSLAVLAAIKALGVRLAVDDFGTGYSSLSYVKRLPIDVLKIDRSFVSGLDSTDEAILRAIAAVGRALHLGLIAEGVETAEQAQRLLALGCKHGQGFYYYRPLPPKAVEPLLWALESSKAAD
ncbi:MAG: EAL domain-containing protein, partial [Mycobacterium leprae]